MKSPDPKGRPTVSVIMPTLNEIEGVRWVMPRFDKRWIDEIIVTDGGSTDGTIEYCESQGARIHRQKKRGYGSSILEALEIAKGDIIVEITADGSSLPEKIPSLVSKLVEGYDLVLASRYRDGAVSDDDDFLTGIGNWMFTTLTNLLFGGSMTDVLVGYRAYKRKSLDLLNMDAPGLEWVSQSSIRFLKSGLKIAEIGIDEPKRIGGQRKMLPFKTGWTILLLTLRERLRAAPTVRDTTQPSVSDLPRGRPAP
ncbi:MAG: glycosyltransferase family 2 protein [Elusimicrobiota bacterium]